MSIQSQQSAEHASDERRGSIRVKVAIPVRIWGPIGWQQAFCDDLSLTGLGLSAVTSPKPGESVRLTLQLADDSPIHIQGTVVREGKFPTGKVGIHVKHSLDGGSQSRLEQFIEQSLRGPLS